MEALKEKQTFLLHNKLVNEISELIFIINNVFILCTRPFKGNKSVSLCFLSLFCLFSSIISLSPIIKLKHFLQKYGEVKEKALK